MSPSSCGLDIYIDGLVQGCSNSIANALELLQSYAKPSICGFFPCFISCTRVGWAYFLPRDRIKGGIKKVLYRLMQGHPAHVMIVECNEKIAKYNLLTVHNKIW